VAPQSFAVRVCLTYSCAPNCSVYLSNVSHEGDIQSIEVHASKSTAAIEGIAALQKELEEHMTSLFEKGQHRLEDVERTIDLVDSTEADLLERRSSLRAEISQHFGELAEHLADRKDQLLRDVDELTSKKQVGSTP
jgi:chromosome segregation ATPase